MRALAYLLAFAGAVTTVAAPGAAVAQAGDESKPANDDSKQAPGATAHEFGLGDGGASVANLVLEVPFEPNETRLSDLARERLGTAATWVVAAPARRLVLLSRPDRENQPPEIAAERANRSLQYLRDHGVTEDQLDNATSSALTRFEPSSHYDVRYVELVERTFDEQTRAERKRARRARRKLRRAEDRDAVKALDLAVFVGAGALDYFASGSRAATSMAASWDATVVARANRRLATEASYVGAAATLQNPGGSSATLVTTLIEGAFRLQSGRFADVWRPYALAGAGLGFVTVRGDKPGMEAYETITYAPLGVGMDFAYDRLRLDLRAIARIAALDDFQGVPDPDRDLGLDHWQVSARLGWQF